LEWFGHVLRTDGTRAVKELLDSKPGRGSKKRKDWIMWMDNVELGLRNMGLQR